VLQELEAMEGLMPVVLGLDVRLTVYSFAASWFAMTICEKEKIILRCEIITAKFVQRSKRWATVDLGKITFGKASSSTGVHQIRQGIILHCLGG
jgi:hypothetical protein